MAGKRKKAKSETPAPVRRRARKQAAEACVSPPGCQLLREPPSAIETEPIPDNKTGVGSVIMDLLHD